MMITQIYGSSLCVFQFYRSTGFGFFLSNPAFVFKLPIILFIDVVLEVIGGGGGGAYGGGTFYLISSLILH